MVRVFPRYDIPQHSIIFILTLLTNDEELR